MKLNRKCVLFFFKQALLINFSVAPLKNMHLYLNVFIHLNFLNHRRVCISKFDFNKVSIEYIIMVQKRIKLFQIINLFHDFITSNLNIFGIVLLDSYHPILFSVRNSLKLSNITRDFDSNLIFLTLIDELVLIIQTLDQAPIVF